MTSLGEFLLITLLFLLVLNVMWLRDSIEELIAAKYQNILDRVKKEQPK